jgi:hypothetical protein
MVEDVYLANVGDLEGFHFPCIRAPETSQILLNKSLLVRQDAGDATAQEIPFLYKILADFVSANYQCV